MARIDTLGHFLTDVADAIREKGGTSGTIQASNFDTAIENLPSGGTYAPRYVTFQNYTGTDLDYEVANLDISNMTSLSNVFSYCGSLVSLDLRSWDFSNITSISNMCPSCTSLESINMSGLNLSNIKSGGQAFTSCMKLKNLSIDFKNAIINQGQGMSNFCLSCTSLETLEIKNAIVANMGSICGGCSSLKSVDFSTVSFDTGYRNLTYAFSGCVALEFLDIRNFPLNELGTNNVRYIFGSGASSYIPANCEVIVKDDNVKTWVLTNYSFLTNVKTVAEYEAEQNQ